jgi:hypothetical protein
MRQCTACRRAKDWSEFNTSTRTRDGVSHVCRDCGREWKRAQVALTRSEAVLDWRATPDWHDQGQPTLIL